MDINATIFGQAIAFILFVAFCMKYVWPPIMTTIENRQKEIAENFSAIERAKQDLYLSQANAKDQLKKATDEANIIIEKAKKRRIQILNDAKILAESERKRIVAQAQLIIEKEKLRIREELRQHIASLALLGAEKIIECSIDETTSSYMIDKLITEL